MMFGFRAAGFIVALLLGSATLLGWISLPQTAKVDPIVVTILLANIAGILAMLAIETNRRPYSLHLMHLIALFLFLGSSSLFQYSLGTFAVAGQHNWLRKQILPVTFATTLWIFGYAIAYETTRFASRALTPSARPGFWAKPIQPSRALVLALIAIVDLVYLAAMGLLGAGTRGAAEEAIASFSAASASVEYSRPLYIINFTLARPLPPIALLTCLLVMWRSPNYRRQLLIPLAIVLGVGTLIINNPFAASRMFLTCTVVAFAATYFLRRFQTGWMMIVATIGGLTVLPVLSASRNTFTFDEFRSVFELISPLDYLARSSDVDMLGMMAMCQLWVDQFGHRWGMQILGAFFSFVPRALWPDKPIATGGMVTSDLGFDFTNLSPPILAEPLVDFGLISVPIFAALFGFVLARLDRQYWAPGHVEIAKQHRVIDAIYPFWLICVVFLTRGDLFAALSFTEGFTFWVLPLGLSLGLAAASRGVRRSPEGRALPAS